MCNLGECLIKHFLCLDCVSTQEILLGDLKPNVHNAAAEACDVDLDTVHCDRLGLGLELELELGLGLELGVELSWSS
jgi:hypothetical protein